MEFDVTLSTFDHPHDEVVATQSVCDGRDEVMAYYTMTIMSQLGVMASPVQG